MATIIAEIVENHSYEDVLAGFEISRVFHVGGLVQAPNRQLIEATQEAGIPQIGDTYPGTTNIDVVRRTSVPDGPNAARVTCIYSARQNVSTYNQPVPPANDGQDVKQISSGTRELVTVLDNGGTPMVINPPAAFTGWDPYLSEAKFLVPAGEIVFERPETSVAASRARNFVGRLNDATVGAYPANTLLFKTLDATSNDGGRIWDCTYTFAYDFGGWQHTDQYHAPDGKVPDGATTQTFDVLLTANFSQLGLDFSDSQTPIS